MTKMATTIAARVFLNVGGMGFAFISATHDLMHGERAVLSYYPGATVRDLKAAGAILDTILLGGEPTAELTREMERLAELDALVE